MMDRLLTLVAALVLTLGSLISIPAFGKIENFDELIATSSAEQTAAYQKINPSAATAERSLTAPVPKTHSLHKKSAGFYLRLVPARSQRRTYYANRLKHKPASL